MANRDKPTNRVCDLGRDFIKRKSQCLVLTSPMAALNATGTAVTEMPLFAVKIPTLIISHKEDGCEKTPPQGAEDIKSAPMHVPTAKVRYSQGGDSPRSKPCKALSAHGLLGIEQEIVDEIASFINKQQNHIIRIVGCERLLLTDQIRFVVDAH